MQSLTGVGYTTSEQHKEASTARQERDNRDIHLILSFLTDRDPFSEIAALRSIATGIVADNKVNAYDAKATGQEIISSMENKSIYQYTFKRSKQVVTMSSDPCTKTRENVVDVDPQLLFQRITAVSMSGHDDYPDLFKYELATHPPSLFDNNGLPRQANKSQLADALWKLGTLEPVLSISTDVQYVLDGGSLLHHIPWRKDATFSDICQEYVIFMERHYKNATIVFDGPSTKDVTHLRRCKGTLTPNVTFEEDMPCRLKKDVFLTNQRNKQSYINLLSAKLTAKGFHVKHAAGYADRLIVLTAVEYSETRNVMVLGEDTDILVLLVHLLNVEWSDLFFASMSSKNRRIWDIKKLKSKVGIEKSQILPAVHALTGCDTTSRLFGIGKGVALKKLGTNECKEKLLIFQNPSSSQAAVEAAGEALLACLSGGVPHEGLDLLRLRLYTSKAISKMYCVQINSLPPTSNSAALHSRRVYYQCQEWIGTNGELNPVEWGWRLSDDKFFPEKCSLPPAPEGLLKVIHCNCKKDCDSKRCTCRKYGIECSIGCGECRGISCLNASQRIEHNDLEDSIEDGDDSLDDNEAS